MREYLNLKSIKADKKLQAFLATTQREFNSFFHFKIVEPLIFLVTTRRDLDLLVGRKTERWFVGMTKNNCIYILDKKKFAKQSNHKEEDFWQTLKHEYSHIYYTQITKSHYPFWLNEGLACLLSGKKLVLKKDSKDKLVNVLSYFNHRDRDIYMVGHYWVEYLLKNYGKRKLVQLIKNLNFKSEINSRQFVDKFFKIYGFRFTKTNLMKMIML
ncbi:MAG: hypothetical protein A2406_04125 [Candidatus Komeilibacteria bacterium RIFOXYC1_FULL_37_11]|uniref:Peptidase MA-like domain-containing protein n=1 Tax=Candidatus Komeilibacteria bacterium RIFOXYC1_FULL_37_11 TaxID=1798555 RepID=A0A1G2BX53_9BACT|nr:MAG: hypothetical protein A2406_04125 [Candidatus Komeilibacteria bacterium RIFOXYC1_FULL_37_11]OGY95831.1 MAG: hypothetical protein A2611_03595 [Candidatus Komeilibacteria bacterium RIFOXYD1_FULL_37_29]OGY97108.1 MAG: hypothetical protein A2543_01950 [Candidatus Komeilibacteria bacterium RIFOXYD2_FULL_37_8]